MEKTSIQAQMLKFINLARQYPAYYISLIDRQLECFINNKDMIISQDIIYQTNEGKVAWIEARKFLQKQIALPSFENHAGLYQSARDHAKDLALHNTFRHTGSDKSTFSERIFRYCRKEEGELTQIIGCDFYMIQRNSPELTILGLIIDDGFPERGHRKTIFNPKYRYLGCKSEIQKDKLITVFNITEKKLQIKGELPNIQQKLLFGNSTYPSFKQITSQILEYNFSKAESNQRKPKISGNKNQSLIYQLSKNSTSPSPQFAGRREFAKVQSQINKRPYEKSQNIKTTYEQGYKIVQKVTQIFYTDGTMQSNIERHATYV